MGLIAKVVGVLLSKAFLAWMIMVVLFAGGLAIDQLQEAVKTQDERERVDEEQSEVEQRLDYLNDRYEESRTTAQNEFVEFRTGTLRVQVARSKRRIAEQQRRLESAKQESIKACKFLGGKPVDAFLFGQPCADTRKKVQEARALLSDLRAGRESTERKLAILQDPNLTNRQKLTRLGEDPDRPGDPAILEQIENKKSERDKLKQDEDDLIQAQDSWAGQLVHKWGESRDRVLDRWSQAWLGLLLIAALILFTPWILRTIAYFVLMPLLCQAQRPLQLAAEPEHVAATLQASSAERTLPIRLSAGEVLSARSRCVHGVHGNAARSQLLYDWKAPFISYAAGLAELSRITGDIGGTEATLSTPDDPNAYLMRIDFENHPGLVMRPTHVVGVIGKPELRTRWRWSIQSLATWQVRYIMFAGTGSLIVQGSGSVDATSPGQKAMKVNQDLMMGFDSRLIARINRTEVFWPYLRGKAPLVDDEFTGPYLLFWQKSKTGGPSNPAAKAVSAFFSTIGKILGF